MNRKNNTHIWTLYAFFENPIGIVKNQYLKEWSCFYLIFNEKSQLRSYDHIKYFDKILLSAR